MGGLIVMRAEVNIERMKEFLDKMSGWSVGIAKLYCLDDVVDITFDVELMGYAEPYRFYDDIKNFVNDVWFVIVGDTELKPGKNKTVKWESCKAHALLEAL